MYRGSNGRVYVFDTNRLTALANAFHSVFTVVNSEELKKNIPHADTLTKRMWLAKMCQTL
jgi:hypothetical protein